MIRSINMNESGEYLSSISPDKTISEVLYGDAQSIRSLCLRKEPEALNLEFKEKTDPSSPVLSKEDRRNIAKSVSAMANGSGGTIIFGIRSGNKSGTDYAAEARPIENIETFEAQFHGAVFSLISPELKSWKTRVIPDKESSNAGFLVCEVGTSNFRPHMSIAAGEHTYYRRSFNGDVPMTPLEVKEQILAVREAQLRLIIKRGGGTFVHKPDWLSIKCDFHFLIENSGQRMCKNPFLRVRTEPLMASYASKDPITSRHKTDFPSGFLLHVGDALPCLTLSANARIVKHQLYEALRTGQHKMAKDAIKIYDGNDDLHSPTISDKIEIGSFVLNIQFGAENSSNKNKDIKFENDFIKSTIFHAARENLVDGWGGKQYIQWSIDVEDAIFGNRDFELFID